MIVDVAIGAGIPFLVAGPLCKLWHYPLNASDEHPIQTILSKTPVLLNMRIMVAAEVKSDQY